MKRVLLLLIILGMSVTLIVGCSSSGGSGPDGDDDQPAENSIGPAGGDVELDGQARLSVPAGALGDTVDFTIEENNSPAAPPAGMDLCSDCVTIGPSGTNFGTPATVTVEYDPADLAGGDEADVVVYTDDGRGWTALTTTVDEGENEASAEVSHLSDFAAMIDTTGGGQQADGVFAALKVARGITYMEMANRDSVILMSDFLQAWFDSTVAPCAPNTPIRVDSVWCENGANYPLTWSVPETLYSYMQFFPLDFLVEGETYTFHVDGGGDVPNLTASIDFPESTPYITDPVTQQHVSLSGFTVTWEGHEGPGTVHLSVLEQGVLEGGVFVETENDGSYTFTSGQLSELVPGYQGAITLNYFNKEFIDETGFDDESYIEAKVTHGVLVVYDN